MGRRRGFSDVGGQYTCKACEASKLLDPCTMVLLPLSRLYSIVGRSWALFVELLPLLLLLVQLLQVQMNGVVHMHVILEMWLYNAPVSSPTFDNGAACGTKAASAQPRPSKSIVQSVHWREQLLCLRVLPVSLGAGEGARPLR